MRHSTTKGYKNRLRLNEEKESTAIRFNQPATNLAIRHTTTNSSRKQQYGNTQTTPAQQRQQHLDCSGNTSIIIAHIFTFWKKGKFHWRKGNFTEKKQINTIILESIHGRRGQRDSNLRVYVSYMTIYKINTYLYVRKMFGKKWQKNENSALSLIHISEPTRPY